MVNSNTAFSANSDRRKRVHCILHLIQYSLKLIHCNFNPFLLGDGSYINWHRQRILYCCSANHAIGSFISIGLDIYTLQTVYYLDARCYEPEHRYRTNSEGGEIPGLLMSKTSDDSLLA